MKTKDAPVVEERPVNMEEVQRRRAPQIHDDDKQRLCLMLGIEAEEEGEELTLDPKLVAAYFVAQKAHHQIMPGPLPLKTLKQLIFDVLKIRVVMMGGPQQHTVPENEIGGGDRIASRNN